MQFFSHQSFSPGELFWYILCPFFQIITFLSSYISWKPFNWVISNLRCFWYYSKCYPTKKTFLQHFPFCWELFCGILGLILGYISLFLESCSILCYEILCRCLFTYRGKRCSKKSFTACVPLLGTFSSIFGSILCILLYVLRN